MRLNYKNIYFLLIFFIFFFYNNLQADEVLYKGKCLNGGSLKANAAALDGLLYNGFDFAKEYNFNLTFNQKDLKYCNLEEKYLTKDYFTGEKLKNKIYVVYLTFTPTPYNPNYQPQYISIIKGGYIPVSCTQYIITDIKKSNNDKSLIVIINNNNFKHGKDIAGSRKTICK